MRLTGALVAAAMLAAGAAAAQVPAGALSLQALKDAASSGAPQAEFALAEAYRSGSGTLKDPDLAILWYKKAAAQGHVPSQDALGLLLFVGGDRRTAVPLLQAAAGRDNARALYVLGTAHFNGDTVPRDRPLAYAELSRAAPRLPAAQRNLDLVKHYLTPAEIAQGEVLLARPTLPAASSAAAPSALAATAVVPKPTAALLPAPTQGAAPPPRPRPSAPPPAASAAALPPPDPSGQPRPRLEASPAVAPAVVTARPVNSAPSPVTATRTPAPAAPPARIGSPPTAVPGRWRVQLGAYSTASRAELQWQMLSGKPPLAAMHHLVTPAGPLFRLQAEGFRSGMEAAEACRVIAATGQGCFAVGP